MSTETPQEGGSEQQPQYKITSPEEYKIFRGMRTAFVLAYEKAGHQGEDYFLEFYFPETTRDDVPKDMVRAINDVFFGSLWYPEAEMAKPSLRNSLEGVADRAIVVGVQTEQDFDAIINYLWERAVDEQQMAVMSGVVNIMPPGMRELLRHPDNTALRPYITSDTNELRLAYFPEEMESKAGGSEAESINVYLAQQAERRLDLEDKPSLVRGWRVDASDFLVQFQRTVNMAKHFMKENKSRGEGRGR